MADRQASVLSSDEGEVFTIGAMKIISRVVGTQSEDAIGLYDLIVDGKKVPRQAGSVASVPRGVHHGVFQPRPGLRARAGPIQRSVPSERLFPGTGETGRRPNTGHGRGPRFADAL